MGFHRGIEHRSSQDLLQVLLKAPEEPFVLFPDGHLLRLLRGGLGVVQLEEDTLQQQRTTSCSRKGYNATGGVLRRAALLSRVIHEYTHTHIVTHGHTRSHTHTHIVTHGHT